jgi:hypothetical protein
MGFEGKLNNGKDKPKTILKMVKRFNTYSN